MTRKRQESGNDNSFEHALVLETARVTEGAALAASRWVGMGDKNAVDGAGTEAMRELLNSLDIRGRVVIGEGGSGGALAIGVGNRVLIQENAWYSVISPEGAASIIWKDAAKAPLAAEALKLTAPDLLELGLVEEVIPEPPGGAHLDMNAAAAPLGEAVTRHLRELGRLDPAELLRERHARFRALGAYTEV